MGNPHQLTGVPARRPAAKPWLRPVLYGAGTVSMLMISMVSSLSLWIGLPWAFLGWSPTLVTTGSMEPLVTPGDVVMVRPLPVDEIVANTVVLFERADGERVLHRVVAAMPDGTFRTQGDANTVPDSEPLHAEQIRGAAVLAVPWVGRPSLWWAEERLVHLALTGVALLVVLTLAPRSFDPAFDPWSSGDRVNPAEVLLGRSSGSAADRRGGSGRRLLPEALHDLVLDRLAAQNAVTHRRTADLVKGLA